MACAERFSQLNITHLFEFKPEKKKIVREHQIKKK
jgi:hypothetical protein